MASFDLTFDPTSAARVLIFGRIPSTIAQADHRKASRAIAMNCGMRGDRSPSRTTNAKAVFTLRSRSGRYTSSSGLKCCIERGTIATPRPAPTRPTSVENGRT